MKRVLIIGSIAILIVAGAASSAWYFVNKDRDQNTKETTEQIVDEQTQEADLAAIKKALVVKNGWDENKIDIVLQKRVGDYATGGAGGKTPQDGGGVWFAAKKEGEWKIVWYGNGSVMCSDLINYPDYPSELIAECYDVRGGKIVVRN